MFALKEKIFSLFSLFSPKHKASLFHRLCLRNKFLLLAVLFFAILWPFRPAYAFLDGLAELISNAIFTLFFRIFIEIGNLILQASLFILNWVLSDGFIPWNYTNPYGNPGNPVIKVGWELTRDLANMSFVVILVAIGLGTALKMGEYQVQKTLPKLIVIALLINFTPVLTGLMVDAANITMNFFLQSVSGLDAWGRVSEAQASVIIQTLVRGGVVLGMIPAIFQTIMLVLINLLSAAIIIAFAGLFAVRYVAIWLLVIVSPIVFASYILPITKRMWWDRWWREFIQWTIVGIPAAFFLYLGNHIMVEAPRMNLNPPSTGIFESAFTSFLMAIVPYGIALIFLWFGFFVALTSSATGANNVIMGVRKGVHSSREWAQKRGKSFARKRWEESNRLRPAAQAAANRMATARGLSPQWGVDENGRDQRGIRGWAKRTAAGVVGLGASPINEAIRATGRTLDKTTGSGISASGKAQLNKAMTEADKLAVEMVISKFRSAGDWATKTGYIKSLVKKGEIDDALKKGLTERDLREVLDKSEVYKERANLLTAMPHLAKEQAQQIANRYRDPETGRTISLAEAYAHAIPNEPFSGLVCRTKIKPDQIKDMMSRQVISRNERNELNHPEILEAIARSWDGSRLAEFLRKFEVEGGDALAEVINRAGGAEWLRQVNPGLYRYLQTNVYTLEYMDLGIPLARRRGRRGGDDDGGGEERPRGRLGFPVPPPAIPPPPPPPPGGGGGALAATSPAPPMAGGGTPTITDTPIVEESTPLRVGKVGPVTESATPAKQKGRLGFPLPGERSSKGYVPPESDSARSPVKPTPPAPPATGATGQAPSAELLEIYNALVQRYSPQVEKGRSKEMMNTIKKLYNAGNIGGLKQILSSPAPPPVAKPKWQTDAESREARSMQREKAAEERSRQREKETEERSKREEKERFEKWNRERKP